ncbi:LPO_1073/Vpar_1526 family protein [Clostridium diolis]|uniref:LPO_1073/Vpar_1526 family protein n=1 Tax=Clostridium diolis TaxID=223919 RepID=UPI0011B1C8C5|nr:LPO_1073/Vpar_1526 family protein [Clostridium diolis]
MEKQKIENIFLNTYPRLFCKGLSEEQIKSIPENARDILIPCLHSPEKLQISALNNDVLDNILKQKLLSNEEREIIKKLFLTERMSEIEVKEFLLQLRPGLFALFDVWDNSSMKNMTLTSVGITIAHANIQRRIGEKFDLSIWI